MTDSSNFQVADWERNLARSLPLFGHRNWIVVADSAYPAQSKPGIETIVSGEDQIPVVRQVFDAITLGQATSAPNLCDKELAFVPRERCARHHGVQTTAPGPHADGSHAWSTFRTSRSSPSWINPPRSFAFSLSRRHDDSVHFGLLRTRLRLLERRMRKNGCARQCWFRF
jgi:hypothetical protein